MIRIGYIILIGIIKTKLKAKCETPQATQYRLSAYPRYEHIFLK